MFYITTICRGFTPNPHFILCLDTKNEARKVKTKRILSSLPEIQEFLTKVIAAIARNNSSIIEIPY